MNIEHIKINHNEYFYYGKRLKASISYYEKEKAFLIKLFTYKAKILKSILIFNDNLTRLENYQKAVKRIREYLKTCPY